jgi:hypothetical protein
MKVFAIAAALLFATSFAVTPVEARKAGGGGYSMRGGGKAFAGGRGFSGGGGAFRGGMSGGVRRFSAGPRSGRAYRGAMTGGVRHFKGGPRPGHAFRAGPQKWKGARHVHRHRHHRPIRRYYGYGGGAAVYLYNDWDYGYGNCEWLYRRAVQTGSGYWWDRFEDCMGY